MEQIKIAIVEDLKSIRESLETFFSSFPDFELVLSQDSVEGFLEEACFLTKDIDILLLDIGLPGMSGLDGIEHILKVQPDVKIIMLTTFEEDDKIFRALCSGAVSYLTKRTSLQKIREAALTVSRGGAYMSPSIALKVVNYFQPKATIVKKENKLTDRQQEIVDEIVNGLSYKMIADKLDISIDTVRYHIKQIYGVLHINSKAELIKKSLGGEI